MNIHGIHCSSKCYIICKIYQFIYLYLLYYPFILHHMFIYYNVLSSRFCNNACSRATAVIPSCSAKTSFLQSQSCGTGPLHRKVCFCVFRSLIFNSLVVAGALMHGEFCVAALSSRLNTSELYKRRSG